MAKRFYTVAKKLTTAAADIVPAVASGKRAMVVFVQAANASADSSNDVTLLFKDASQSNTEFVLVKNMVVPVGAAVLPVGGRLVLEAGDAMSGLASATDVVHVTVTILEEDVA